MSAAIGPNAPLVLVVDDDVATLDTIRDVLGEAGYRVLTASNGADALEYLRASPPPDLAIVDLMMPGMDGWTFTSELRQDPRLARTPLVVMSAGGERLLARAPIARAYMPKPLDLVQLLSVIEHHARRDRSSYTRERFRTVTQHHVSTSRLRVPVVLAITGDQAFVDAHRETVACAGAVLHAVSLEDAVARATEPSTVAVMAPTATIAEAVIARLPSTLRVLVAAGSSPYQLEASIRSAVQRRAVG